MQQAKMDLQHASVAVIGAGTMGIGIAQLAAMHGHKTYVFDVDVARTEQALAQLGEVGSCRSAFYFLLSTRL